MSLIDDYARLEEFLLSDPEYARLESEIERLKKVREESDEAADIATRNYHKWMCCESALQDKANLLTDDGDLDFVFSADLVAEYLADGQEKFERMKRAELVKAGEASQVWLKADEDLELAYASYRKVRPALVQIWHNKQEAN